MSCVRRCAEYAVYVVLCKSHTRYVVILLCSVLTNEATSSGPQAPCTQVPSKWSSLGLQAGIAPAEPTLGSALCLSVVALEAWDYFVYPVGQL